MKNIEVKNIITIIIYFQIVIMKNIYNYEILFNNLKNKLSFIIYRKYKNQRILLQL